MDPCKCFLFPPVSSPAINERPSLTPHMNPPALLSESFSLNLNDPVTSEGEYISSHVTGFADEDDNSQRVGGLASMPDTNGVRYHAQQPAMQDLQ